jgi:hypothetical protein
MRFEAVFIDHGIPERFFICHDRFQRHGKRRRQFEIEKVGSFWPHLVPTEQITIVYVKRLIGASLVCRCPKPLLSLEDRHPSFLIVYRKLLVYLGTLTGAPIPSTWQHKPQSQERNPTPKAESAFSQLSQWLNRTLRSIVPKTLEELFAGNSIH